MNQEISERLLSQIRFIKEIDKLKSVFRQTPLLDGSRMENDAEHSWHLAMIAIVLAEYAPEEARILRILKMLLVHDLVEIDAGDTMIYDDAATAGQQARELEAAERIFAILPQGQEAELRTLWDEFETGETVDARFAKAIDRLQPLLHNHQTEGVIWLKHGISRNQVVDKNIAIAQGAPELWPFAQALINDAVDRRWLTDT